MTSREIREYEEGFRCGYRFPNKRHKLLRSPAFNRGLMEGQRKCRQDRELEEERQQKRRAVQRRYVEKIRKAAREASPTWPSGSTSHTGIGGIGKE